MALDVGQQADLGINRDQVVGHPAQDGERLNQLLGRVAWEEGRQVGQGEGLQRGLPSRMAVSEIAVCSQHSGRQDSGDEPGSGRPGGPEITVPEGDGCSL